jgi:O-antigen/teichoic acid export membrane protein
MNRVNYNNIFILILGTVLSQLVPVALQPLLRRQYTPEDFGQFAMFSAVTEVLVTIASFRYEQAILIPKEDEESKDIFKLTLLICLIFNTIVLLFFTFIALFDINYLKPKGISNLSLLLIPLTTFFFSVINSGSHWYNRSGSFKDLSLNKLYRRVSEGITQVFFGFLSNPLGLIFGMFFGVFISSFHVFYKTKILKKFFFEIDFHYSKYIFLKYNTFFFYGVFPSLLYILSTFIPVFIISSHFSTNIVGQFDLSRQVLAFPLVIISMSLNQVLIKKVILKFHNNESFMKELNTTFFATSIIAILIIIGYYIIGNFLVLFVFGEKWKIAAQISEILVIGYGVKFVSTSIYHILIPLNKLKVLGIWQIINFLLSLCLAFPYFNNSNIEFFAISYTVFEVVSNTLCIIFVYKVSRDVICDLK